jgi:nicotinate dehydrogenase subunit B
MAREEAMISDLSRRDFLKQTGVLAVGFSFGPRVLRAASTSARLAPVASKLDSWLVISADNSVTVFCGKVELGTGVSTALRQIVAEELDAQF